MRPAFIKSGFLIAILSMPLPGCGSVIASGPVTYAHCGLDSHTEAFPNNPHPRRAYGCRSNQSGFLSPPNGPQESLRPQP